MTIARAIAIGLQIAMSRVHDCNRLQTAMQSISR
jgi:hypothetical protein